MTRFSGGNWSWVLALVTLLALPARSFAQTEEEIEEARLQGLKYIQSEQLEDGSWAHMNHNVGITALCAIALIENGIPVSDISIERAHRYVIRNHEEVQNTYELALSILLISRIGDRDDREVVRTLAARLICGQNTEGGWSYTCPKVPANLLTNKDDRPDPPAGPGDNSCTQFAVLGLWASSRWGVNIDETMENVDQRFSTTQEEDGGWPYSHAMEESPSTESMTFAALFCLTVARATEIRAANRDSDDSEDSEDGEKEDVDVEESDPDEGADEGGTDSEGDALINDPHFSDGLERAVQFAQGIHNGSARYFLWSVERLGVLLGIEKFGETDWFNKGAAALIASQAEDGSWEGSWGKLCDTCFAILFLRKANLGSDISRMLEGDPDQAFQILSQEGEPRFSTLVEALATTTEGDVIRVEGDGPFDMPHIDLDHGVRIVAGAGYEPVFVYEIGYDADGRRSRPEEDREARHMIRIRSGLLELEGLLLQMDPPELGRAITDWSAIRLEGGNLRMLNCRLSESNPEGSMAGIYITQPGDVQLRNCILVGGRAALEVLTCGPHQVRIENGVIFSTHAFHVFNGAAGADARLSLTLNRCAIHAQEIFFFPRLTNPVDIVCNGCALKGDYMGSQMLQEPNGHEGLSWTGINNIYEVAQWVGAARTMNSRVTDAASWSRFWGGSDEDGENEIIPFAGRRSLGGYTHGIRGQDFEFSNTSQIYASRRRSGIDPLIAGPGEGYSRFRESFDYRSWEDPEYEMAQVTETSEATEE